VVLRQGWEIKQSEQLTIMKMITGIYLLKAKSNTFLLVIEEDKGEQEADRENDEL